MKKILLILTLLFVNVHVHSQTIEETVFLYNYELQPDEHIYVEVVNKSLLQMSNVVARNCFLENTGAYKLAADKVFLLGGFKTCMNGNTKFEYLELFYAGEIYYTEKFGLKFYFKGVDTTSAVTMLMKLKKLNKEDSMKLFENTLRLSYDFEGGDKKASNEMNSNEKFEYYESQIKK